MCEHDYQVCPIGIIIITRGLPSPPVTIATRISYIAGACTHSRNSLTHSMCCSNTVVSIDIVEHGGLEHMNTYKTVVGGATGNVHDSTQHA